jgi:DedD protein
MAERSNATSKKNQDAAQDVSTLQKRGRRRLVGAIALVLLAVIVLPMVFDPEPRPNTPTVSIRIPSEEGSRFTPKAQPKPAAQPIAPKAEEKVVAPTPAPAPAPAPAPEPPKAVAEAPVVKPAEKKAAVAPAKPAEKKPVPAAAAASTEQFMVQVGAFASPEKVKEITDQLKEARLTHYTETVATAKGSVTRVRLGPFASKEAAEKARERAKALGLNPANPVAK